MRFLRCSYSVQSIALIIIIVIIWCSEAVRPPKTISVNKCCGAGERLSENFECIIDNDEDWWPLIFMIIKQSYFKPNGLAPRFMKFHKQRPVCEKPEVYIGKHKVAIFSNGSLYLSEKHKFIEPQNYCVDRNVGIICDSDANSPTGLVQAINKLRKCCVQNAVYKTSDSTCVPINGHDFNFPQYDIVFGFPACKVSKYFTIAETFKETNLDRDTNRLILETGRTLPWQEFCVEHVIDKEMSQISVFTCADYLAVIQNTEENSYTDIRFILFPIGLLISVCFLSATLAIRYLLPSNHHHILHYRCQTFYISTLLIGDLLLAFTHLLPSQKGFTCISIAVCMHFFFLSAFFWLNTMCINVFLTFKDFRPKSLERSQEKVRLRIYKIYAWGVPILISGCAATLDHIRKNSSTEDTYLQPRFCEKEYWFAGNLEKLAYFYGPIGVLLLINFVLFASTTRQLTCGLWKREDVKSTTERTTLGAITLKLVIVMGVTWMADILSFLHGIWFGGYSLVWIITDLINALQGVFIFFVIGCQPQVSSVMKQIWRSKSRNRNTEGGQHNNNSSSSQVASIGESITNNTLTTSNAKISAETAC